MRCLYNLPPFRTKDLPYLDVLSESVNNPLRMLAGWYMTRTLSIPPSSLLISYWMIGSFLMAIKGYAEHRELDDPLTSSSYRKSFGYYNEELISIMVYAAHAMLFWAHPDRRLPTGCPVVPVYRVGHLRGLNVAHVTIWR